MHQLTERNEMSLKRVIVSKVVIVIFLSSVFFTGCITDLKENMTPQQTTAPLISPTSPSIYQSSQFFTPIPNQGKNNKTAFITQSEDVIRKFTGTPEMNLTYMGIMNESYADLYRFSSVNSSFWVNNVTGRVQSMVIYEVGSKTQREIIDLDQGSAIAETYAREKYPELWNITDVKGIIQTIKNVNDRGSDRIFEYSWQDILYTPDKNIDPHTEISGMNSVTVIVNPNTGHITSYHEWYSQSEPLPNLTPTLTEEQAWIYAELYFKDTGITDIQPTEIASKKMTIATDDKGKPCLTWNFDVMRRNKLGFSEGGVVGIDAHDGHIVWHASI
jgi:hypothetical protein